MTLALVLLRLAQRAWGSRMHPSLRRTRFFVNLGGLIIVFSLAFFLIRGNSAWMFNAYCLMLWTLLRVYLSFLSDSTYRREAAQTMNGRRP